ncbi:MAG: preprotein translocase subunit SecE [Patescibacteria group bacterium]
MSLTNNRVVNYFKEAKIELKKVAWPTRKETTKHTLLVIGISLALAAFLGALDYFFTIGFEKIIER